MKKYNVHFFCKERLLQQFHLSFIYQFYAKLRRKQKNSKQIDDQTFCLLQIQLYQLTRLIHDNYRDLHDHFEEHEIAPNLYATPWFLTLFASQYPLGFVARVFG